MSLIGWVCSCPQTLVAVQTANSRSGVFLVSWASTTTSGGTQERFNNHQCSQLQHCNSRQLLLFPWCQQQLLPHQKVRWQQKLAACFSRWIKSVNHNQVACLRQRIGWPALSVVAYTYRSINSIKLLHQLVVIILHLSKALATPMCHSRNRNHNLNRLEVVLEQLLNKLLLKIKQVVWNHP